MSQFPKVSETNSSQQPYCENRLRKLENFHLVESAAGPQAHRSLGSRRRRKRRGFDLTQFSHISNILSRRYGIRTPSNLGDLGKLHSIRRYKETHCKLWHHIPFIFLSRVNVTVVDRPSVHFLPFQIVDTAMTLWQQYCHHVCSYDGLISASWAH